MWLHISYRLDFLTWQARGAEKQELLKKRKKKMQEELRSKLGLTINLPKAGGSGTSNDGNCA